MLLLDLTAPTHSNAQPAVLLSEHSDVNPYFPAIEFRADLGLQTDVSCELNTLRHFDVLAGHRSIILLLTVIPRQINGDQLLDIFRLNFGLDLHLPVHLLVSFFNQFF